MTNASSHPNPAEVCKSRGWQIGDTFKLVGVPITITYIGSNYTHGELDDGKPYTCRHDHDIRTATKVEPPPVVTVEKSEIQGNHKVTVNGAVFLWANSGGYASHDFSREACERFTRIMAAAGKAAIEAELGNGKEATEEAKPEPEKPTADIESIRAVLLSAHRDIGEWLQLGTRWRDESPDYSYDPKCPTDMGMEASEYVRRQIAAGLAALNGVESEPREAEGATQAGPYKTTACDPSGTDVWIDNHRGNAINVWAAEQVETDFGIPAIAEIVSRHAREIAAELNALHAKGK